MVIDLTQRPLRIDPDDRSMPGGLTGFVGWHRLVDQLRAAGEFKADETVTHFKVNASGIHFVVRTK